MAVIGGHPGITPFYRGAYPAFWALAHGRPDMVGYTVFLLDDGIDTGPILFQGPIAVERGDSHLTLNWKAAIRQAELQAEGILRLDGGDRLPVRSITLIRDGSYYGPPTIVDLIRYRIKQRLAR